MKRFLIFMSLFLFAGMISYGSSTHSLVTEKSMKHPPTFVQVIKTSIDGSVTVIVPLFTCPDVLMVAELNGSQYFHPMPLNLSTNSKPFYKYGLKYQAGEINKPGITGMVRCRTVTQ